MQEKRRTKTEQPTSVSPPSKSSKRGGGGTTQSPVDSRIPLKPGEKHHSSPAIGKGKKKQAWQLHPSTRYFINPLYTYALFQHRKLEWRNRTHRHQCIPILNWILATVEEACSQCSDMSADNGFFVSWNVYNMLTHILMWSDNSGTCNAIATFR